MRPKPLRVLLVEDSEVEAARILECLQGEGYDCVHERVNAEPAMRLALVRQEWDLVLCDHDLPHFSAPAALDILRQSRRTLPFIIVSGSLGEEAAVEAMRAGADDFVSKANLARLGPVVGRSLRESSTREMNRVAEEALRRHDAILVAVGAAAERLLRPGPWEEAMREVLTRVGAATGLGRIFVIQNHRAPDGDLVTNQRFEWIGHDAFPQAPDPWRRAFSWRDRGLGGWAEALARGEPRFGLTSELPDGERETVEMLGVRSFALAPIMVSGEWWGTVGISAPEVEHVWSAIEVRALSTLAGTLGGAIQRAADQAQILQQLERLAALRTIDLAIMGEPAIEATLEVLLDQTLAQLPVDAAAVLIRDPLNGRLRTATSRGFAPGAPPLASLPAGGGLVEQAIARQCTLFTDLAETPGLLRAPHLRAEGFVAYAATPLVVRGTLHGVLEIYRRQPFPPDPDWREFLELLAGQAAIAIDSAVLVTRLQRSNDDLAQAYDRTLEGWSRALDMRDRATEGHTRRVAQMTLRLARTMGIGGDALVHLRRGALLHDIGKMGVPDSILHKPGPLTETEWEVMKLHPVQAYELLSSIPFLHPALDIPYCHHEQWNGGGYPRGLRGEEIPLAARIFAVADVWDAMCSDRPYRQGIAQDIVHEFITDSSGSLFDPAVVEVFGRIVRPRAPRA